MQSGYRGRAIVLIALAFTLVHCGTNAALEAQNAAVSFAESVTSKTPKDYRVSLKGHLRAVDVFLQTFAVEYDAVHRPGPSWQQIHSVLHEQGHPLSLYDSSWKAQSTLSNEKEAKVVLTSPSGKAINLVMSLDRGSWKVDWKKANPFDGMKRAR